MATRKPISTISYNTVPFLKEKLDSWVKAHKIQAYFFIRHKGEDGDKDHTHVRIEPNQGLDPMNLTEELREWVPGSDKPLGCRPWRESKEEDAVLYFIHDPQYLQLKYGGGEKGEKLPYKLEDFVCSEGYDMEIAYIRAKASLQHTSVNMASRMQGGDSPISLILQGENPYMVNSIMRALSTNDYQRLASENQKLSEQVITLDAKLQNLIAAVSLLGYDVKFEDDGDASLSPRK